MSHVKSMIITRLLFAPGDKSRSHRRRGQTFRHICFPDTRHRAGHPTRRALPRPGHKVWWTLLFSSKYFRFTHPLINLAVLQLDKPGRDGRYVALLVGEGHPAGALGVAELRVGVDTRVADAAIQAVHDHGQLNWGNNC